MTDYLRDTFTETSDTVLSSHTPDTGGTWAEHASYATDATVIASEDRVAGGSDSLNSHYYWSTAMPVRNEHDVSCTVRFTQDTTNTYGAVCCRIDTGAITRIEIVGNPLANQWTLNEISAGSTIGSDIYDATIASNTNYIVRLVVIGNEAYGYIDGTLQMQRTLTTVTANGYVGMRVRLTARIDDFVARNVREPQNALMLGCG